jgi:hypothetical protein
MTYSQAQQRALEAHAGAATDAFFSALVHGASETRLDQLRAAMNEADKASADYWHSDTAVVLDPPDEAVQAYMDNCGGLDGGGEF